jgi:ribonuclease HII
VIIGIDEAGRGALAGPVVVCACAILEPINGLNDSKKLTPGQRERLAKIILQSSITTIAIGSNNEIDRINILQSTLLAMKRATDKICGLCNVDLALIDGNKVPSFMPCPVKAIINGDEYEFQIMAASIVAKVIRDHIMNGYGKSLPGYGFEIHKGYGTKAHYEALTKLGPSKIHRRSFRLC